MTAGEPEPNGWELLRGMKEIRESVERVATGMVSQPLFAAALDRVAALEATRVTLSLYALALERIAALEAEQVEQRKTRAQMWFAIGMSILGGAIAVIGGIILYNMKGGA